MQCKYAGNCAPYFSSNPCPFLSLLPWPSMGMTQPHLPCHAHRGREERTHSWLGKISLSSKPGCYFGKTPLFARSLCISHWGSWSHPVTALTHFKSTHTLRSKSHPLSLYLQDVQGNPVELLKDWKHNKGFNMRFNHRTAIALPGWSCGVKLMAHAWPKCIFMSKSHCQRFQGS